MEVKDECSPGGTEGSQSPKIFLSRLLESLDDRRCPKMRDLVDPKSNE